MVYLVANANSGGLAWDKAFIEQPTGKRRDTFGKLAISDARIIVEDDGVVVWLPRRDLFEHGIWRQTLHARRGLLA